jgi:hypothetical protein
VLCGFNLKAIAILPLGPLPEDPKMSQFATWRGLLHAFMCLAMIACIVSLLESATTQSRLCPICSGRASRVHSVRSRSADRKELGRVHSVFRCTDCAYEVFDADESYGTQAK